MFAVPPGMPGVCARKRPVGLAKVERIDGAPVNEVFSVGLLNGLPRASDAAAVVALLWLLILTS